MKRIYKGKKDTYPGTFSYLTVYVVNSTSVTGLTNEVHLLGIILRSQFLKRYQNRRVKF